MGLDVNPDLRFKPLSPHHTHSYSDAKQPQQTAKGFNLYNDLKMLRLFFSNVCIIMFIVYGDDDNNNNNIIYNKNIF